MAPDDRERTFESALARHFRSGSPQSDCLDAEVLAAYHERLLSPEQMTSCRQHITSCARCQQILAYLEATDDLMVESDQQVHSGENVLTMPAPQQTPELVHASVDPAAAGPVAVASRSSRVAQSQWRSKALRGANWRWLAPAGLIAAGLLLWISFHETPPKSFQLAKNTQTAASPPAPARSAPSPALPLSPGTAASERAGSTNEKAEESAGADLKASTDRDEARGDESAAMRKLPEAENKPVASDTPLRSAMLDQKQSNGRSTGQLGTPSSTMIAPGAKKESDADQELSAAAATPLHDAGAAQDKLTRKQDSQAPAPATPGFHKDTENAVAANAPVPQTGKLVQSETVAGGREAPDKAKVVAGVLAGGATSLKAPAMRLAKSRGYATVTAPNSTTMWRIAPAGLVERSTDAGSTWSIQPTGVVADLLSASAPSARVCWIVGRNATILRTTDGGEHWTQLTSPASADITSIFAVNANEGTITTSTHDSYMTKDAGQTWSRVPKP